MDERTIIPIDVEHAQTTLERERELDLLFRQQWKLVEDYPACPVGLTLLRRFAERQPDLFEFYVRRNLTQEVTVPAILRNPLWIAYQKHLDTCEDCNEA